MGLKNKSKLIKRPIVWIDCEMTGLDVFQDTIIEICCIITDGDLNIIDPHGYESVIHKSDEILNNMNQWCITHHGKSGLTEKVRNSKKDLKTVSNELFEYIEKYIPLPRSALLAGNSVHMDKFFMIREFPKIIDHLHYRIIDVSTIFEICKRHNSKLADHQPRKKNLHTAKADILESIDQLKWFEKYYFKKENEVDFNAVVLGGMAKLSLS